MVLALRADRDQEKKHAEELQVQNLRLQLESERYKKWYYGPRADRLQSDKDVARMLLNFAEDLDRKPIQTEDLPQPAEPAEELRRVKRRKGRRNLANFENLPVTTHVYELSEAERVCPCRGLLSYIVTSKFSGYLPLYRLEDIFARRGFEISRATQSVWCRDVADLVEPLYHQMTNRVRASHVVATDDTIMPMRNKDKTANARMWVYVGDEAQPYNVFDFTLDRGRDGPKRFLKDYGKVLLADGYAGYNGVVVGNAITRAGCWAHMKRKLVDAGKSAPEIAREAVEQVRALHAVERRSRNATVDERLTPRREQSVPLLAELHDRLLQWKQQLPPKHPMAEAINHALG